MTKGIRQILGDLGRARLFFRELAGTGWKRTRPGGALQHFQLSASGVSLPPRAGHAGQGSAPISLPHLFQRGMIQ